MAFNTRGQNSPPSYLDGISVKISEKYKPPKKINVALSYSQMLTLNKLIHDPYPNYEFTLEESIKTRVNEWRKVRSTLAEERKQRLQILSQERDTKNWTNEIENPNPNPVNDVNEVLTKSNSDSTSDISNNKDTEISSTTTTTTTTSSSSTTTTSHFYKTESGVLIPMTHSQQLLQQQQQDQQSNLNRPVYQIERFNFSEFESDTSSPFDNMELKTINDLEELAEVLKRDSDINSSNVIENNYINSSNVDNNTTMYDNNAYAYKPLPIPLANIANSKECHINGYYYNHHTPIYTSKVMYGPEAVTASQHIAHGNDLKHAQAQHGGSPIRSVTEIMKSLHEQFAANHITTATTATAETNSSSSSSQTPLSKQFISDTASSSSKRIIHHPHNIVDSVKKTSDDLLDNPYNQLSPDLQKMAVTISNMGFPLARVARACQALDGNQKKIVEHLLAMSELLDLGFSEENVVNALLKCDNDRDKALDILIT